MASKLLSSNALVKILKQLPLQLRKAATPKTPFALGIPLHIDNITPMTQDRNFDDLSLKFQRKIYQSPKGLIRLEIVWEDLLATITALNDKPLRILDAGCGMGQIALRLAKLGHELVLCDHSQEMLALAQQTFAAELPDAKVSFIHCPVQQLSQHVEGAFDLVLFHAVLEWLAEPEQTLKQVLAYCRPGACLSLLFYNRDALSYFNLIKGNFRKVAADDYQGDANSLTPTNPLLPSEVLSWLTQDGKTVIRKSGVRCFYDNMWREAQQSRSFEDVLAMERQFARQEPFASLGRYQHWIVR